MIRLCRITTLTSYFGLFFLLIAWISWLSPPRILPTALVLLILAGPLLFPLRGILQGKPYTHIWASFIALFYFAVGIYNVAGGDMDKPWLAWLEILFSVLLFLGTLLYARSVAK